LTSQPPAKPTLIIEPLGVNHDRAAFSCGIAPLDGYLKTQAGQDMKKNLAAVYVATPDGKTIAGYYTLSAYSVSLDSIPGEIAKKLTTMPEVPSTLIGRLARSDAFPKQGIGEILLTNALKRSWENSKHIASWAVIVDAKDANAAAFYKKYSFLELPATPNRLFLPMATIAKLFPLQSTSASATPSSSAAAPATPSPATPSPSTTP
jgi:predicted GNAT family N-acyltransferase